jgi:L-iditol 2-dehydrogenase
MKAAFLRKAGDLVVEEVPRPACGPGQLLVGVKEVGICGSDLHYFNEGRIGDHVVTAPHVLGHEASGVVVEAGAGVQGFAAGDRVCLEPGVPCGACAQCQEGRYNLCEAVRFSGAPPHHGMFRELVCHDPRFVYKVPDQVSFTQAAMAEPLAVAHNAVHKSRFVPGGIALVIGAGPIGFSCIEMLRAAGAALVIASEPLAFRRQVAARVGADRVFDPSSGSLVDFVREATGGRMCDAVFEASAADSAIADAVRAARRGGRVVFVGMGKPMVSIPHAEVLKKEVTISGVYRYQNDFGPVIALLAAGRLHPEEWVSHRLPLGRISEAVAIANDPSRDKLKVMVTM